MSEERDECLADALSYWVDLLNAGREMSIEEYVRRYRVSVRGELGNLCRAALIVQDLDPSSQARVTRKLGVLRKPLSRATTGKDGE